MMEESLNPTPFENMRLTNTTLNLSSLPYLRRGHSTNQSRTFSTTADRSYLSFTTRPISQQPFPRCQQEQPTADRPLRITVTHEGGHRALADPPSSIVAPIPPRRLWRVRQKSPTHHAVPPDSVQKTSGASKYSLRCSSPLHKDSSAVANRTGSLPVFRHSGFAS
jgi:hypothetical protein